jgi:uncharacterized cupredoxin-like copper-binding protein
MFAPTLGSRSSALRPQRFVKPALLSLSVLALALGAAACGGDDESSGTSTTENTQAEPAAVPSVVSVQLGEDGSKYFVKLDKSSVVAGTTTFKIDNVGTTHHELAFYRTDVAAGELPIDDEDKAVLDEAGEAGEAVYATPVRGDPDHRIRDGRGVDYTLDLEPGAYVLLCNLAGHYKAGQFAAFTVEEATADNPAPAEPTETAPAEEAPVAEGTPVAVQLGEDGAKFFVKVDTASVPAGATTFKIDNVGTTHHELAIYRTDVAAGELEIDDEDKAVLDETAVAGEAVYVTPVRGDPDHRIRDGRGVDYTLDLEPGAYVLLCNLAGHYKAGQYTAFTVE